jgi:DNA-binding HxlR family transcriptional regulator
MAPAQSGALTLVRRLAKHYGCPTEFTLQLLGGKWKTVILCYLKEGPWRYGELRGFLPRLSDKVLTERLKELEAAGLIERSGSGTGAQSVRYGLSARAESLRGVLTAIYQWGDRNAATYGVQCDNPLRRGVRRMKPPAAGPGRK